jgi:exosortase
MSERGVLGAPDSSAQQQGLAPPRVWAAVVASPIVVLVLALCLGVVLFWPSWIALAREWTDSESRYSHGFLLLAAGLVLMAGNLPSRVDFRASPRPRLALVALAVASLLWLVAHRAAIVAVEQLLALSALIAFVYYVLGRRVGTIAAVPLALLALALPIWDVAMDSFQRATIMAVRALAALVRLPARFEGTYVHLDAGVFEIAESCNGLQLFLAACAVGGLLAVRRADRLPVVALVVCVAGVVGLLANWLRVFVVVLAGYLSDMQHYLVTSEHYTLGWSFFGLGMLLLAWRLGQRTSVPAAAHSGSDGAAQTRGRAATALAGAVLCLAIGPAIAWAARIDTNERHTISMASWQLPGWNVDAPTPEWRPTFVGPTGQGSAAFRRSGGSNSVAVHVARFTQIENGREIAGQSVALWPRDWTVDELAARDLAAHLGTDSEVGFHVVTDFADRSWAVAVRYQSSSRLYSSAVKAQLDFAITGVGAAAACGVVVAASPCDADCRAAGKLLLSFFADARHPLTAAIATRLPEQ